MLGDENEFKKQARRSFLICLQRIRNPNEQNKNF